MKGIRAHIARVMSILMIMSLLTGGIVLTGAGPDSTYSYAAEKAENDFRYTVSGGKVTLTAYKGNSSKPVIPSSIGGRKVTAIGPGCFRGNVRITRIKVPEGVTKIGDYAFEACSAATKVTLPSTLKRIGKGAFSGDGMLKSIVIPDKVSRIDDGAFLYCMGVTSITGGKGLAKLGQFVFAGCESLKTVDIGGPDLKAIPDRTFCNCTYLTSVKLPDSVGSIGKRAFSRCRSLAEISFGPNLKSVGDYAFEECGDLRDLTFDVNSKELSLGSNILYDDFTTGSAHIIMPDNTLIREDTFKTAAIDGLYVSGQGRLRGENEYIVSGGQLYGGNGSELICACSDRYDSTAGEWLPVTEKFMAGSVERVRFTVPDGVRRIGPEAFAKKTYDNVVLPDSIEEIDDKAFVEGAVRSLSFSGSNSRYFVEEGVLYENTGASDSARCRLVQFFPRKADGDTMSSTTVKSPPVEDDSVFVPDRQFTLPDSVSDIAPYAFYGAILCLVISDDTSLEGFGDHSFANSGIVDPRIDNPYQSSGGVIAVSDKVLSRLVIADTAFDDTDDYFVDFTYDEEEDEDESLEVSSSEDIQRRSDDYSEDIEFNDRFARADEEGVVESSYEDDDDYQVEDPVVSYRSLSGDRSLYSKKKYGKYKVIPNSGFNDWCNAYLEHNRDEIEFSQELMPYTMQYKGESHYRSMVCVLNHDEYKTQYAILNTGDDFAPMYRMMDHGLEAELMRGEVQDDLVLYSGITVEKMAEIAGFSDKSVVPSVDQLVDAIGGEFTDLAFMSTTSDPRIAATFSSHSETMVVIYASKESMRRLGAVCLDSFTGWGAGEYEILFNAGAKFKVLDVGTLTVGDSKGNVDETRTYVRLELSPDEAAPAAPKIRTSAVSGRKMQVKWGAVKGAVKYKLQYRKAGASKWKTIDLKGTSKILTGMKTGGLYQFRTAAVGSDKKTGKYSNRVCRFYRIASGVRYKAGKSEVRVSWKRTKGASGYLILVSENKDLKDARTITVKSGKKTSATVRGLKSGKRYYFAVRPYKNRNGIRYNGIRSKIVRIN